MVQDRAGRSCARPLPLCLARSWPAQRRPLPSADPLVPLLDPPEPVPAGELVGLLTPGARADLRTAAQARTDGGRA